MLNTKRICFICSKREGDLTVVIEGRLADICEPCYSRGDEPAIRTDGVFDDEEQDLNREGDPAFNGAFNRW